MDFLKKGISKVKDTVSQVELITKINEATANESGFANISLLNEISSRADNTEECKNIVKYCIKLLGLKPKLWKRILRTLALIEHIIKTGSQDFVDRIKDERDRLRDLYEFNYEEEGKDRGEPIREKAKYIFELVTDSFKLKDEKKKYSAWKSRIEGVGSGGSTSYSNKSNFGKDGGSYYGSTSSNSYGGTISKYYDRNKDKKDKDKDDDDKKKKKEESDSDSESSSEDKKKKKKKKGKKG
jgi:epsin